MKEDWGWNSGSGSDFLELAGFHYEKALKEMIEIEAQ